MSGQRLSSLELLARLVGFNTISSESNLDLIDFIAEYLAGWGVASVRIPDETGRKAALFATIGLADRGGVVLSGHTDVVPVEGQPWSSDPFRLTVRDGRAYGRGAVDMKGFCALVLAAVPDFVAAGLKTPIHLFFSYDEEVSCLGVVDGIRRFGHDLPLPVAVIVGEPTGLEVADAHKSIAMYTTTVSGASAHSSNPGLGASAVHGAVLIAAELDRLSLEYEARGDESGRFDPPFSTIHVGHINGGVARNILASEASVLWEVRGLPDLPPNEIPARLEAFVGEHILPRFRRTFSGYRVETVMDGLVPALAPSTDPLARTLMLKLAGRNRTVTVAYGTEAGHFANAGIPTVVCGPGSIDRAHKADEYITLEELAAGEACLRQLASDLSRSALRAD
ncbi:acetylornithine deacetylase [Pseudochelatococcus contaminans]|uniref:Acetylornithine deacetylase n=1 Tax=Pseudochelatococcus contaminans TaxID=1538103 RepID=A0A7W6EHD8_9HYPH|nr:acetylornithine deacetylase [Pseudochelatococcus contaminans]MBB3810050.1 acetylornithine deacetylase [Pseudochelatococcus contaminans]